MIDHTAIPRRKHKLPLPEMTVPSGMRLRPRCTTSCTYRRRIAGFSVGKKRYEAVIDVQLTDGTVLVGYPLNPMAPKTSFQAKKLLKRYGRDFPHAYCMVSQSFF